MLRYLQSLSTGYPLLEDNYLIALYAAKRWIKDNDPYFQFL